MGNETTVINIIPSDYEGDPRSALGYPWQDYATKTPGHDVIVDRTENGIDYMGAAQAKMAELGVTSAYVTCMWCGGFSGDVTSTTEEPKAVDQPAPLSVEEVAANERRFELDELARHDRRYENHPGYCKKCHSFCYGDCEAA